MATPQIDGFKTCTKCGEAKPATAFTRKRETHDGLSYRCKVCASEDRRGRYDPEKNREACRQFRERHREALNERDRARYTGERKRRAAELKKAAWARLTPDERAAKRVALRQWMEANPDKVRAVEIARNERIKAQREADPEFKEKLNKKTRAWQANKRRTDPVFREKVIAGTRRWHQENRLRQNAYKRALCAKRRKTDVGFRLASALRSRVGKALKGQCSGNALRLLGCSAEELRSHIESRFKVGMTWENWGRGWHGARQWHLDHIKALSTFDLTDPEQLSRACHYTNLQPLWASENLSKGASEWQDRQP